MKRECKPACRRRVALYARVSSDRQATDSQVSAIRVLLEKEGDVLAEDLCFRDHDVSGATLMRPALERLRAQAAAGAIDRLYVLVPDRLARRHSHQMLLLKELQDRDMEVVFVNRPLDVTADDPLLLQAQALVAE